MKKVHISAINRKLKEDQNDFIHKCEKSYFSQVKSMADVIYQRGDSRPIVLLSGPSGSGKTTTSLKLEQYLDSMGMCTHTISMDNYFLPAHENHLAKNENGEIDYESPYRLDIPLLNEHMMKIANCEEVILPSFDFKRQERVKGDILKRNPGDIVVFEGIHALNPDVTGMTDGFANCVYVSVRSRIQTSDGACLHPCMIRLMRRIIRDKFFRARQPAETLAMFDSVERGENLYIMPYKQRAEFNIDTFIPYEVSVYKSFLYDDLTKALKACDDFDKFCLITSVFDELDTLNIDLVPPNALIREFIGGSSYEY